MVKSTEIKSLAESETARGTNATQREQNRTWAESNKNELALRADEMLLKNGGVTGADLRGGPPVTNE